MPRSSRSKSHKQKVKEYSDSEDDVKVKEKNNGKEEISSVSAARVSKDLSSGDKRKFSSQGRESKDLSGHGNSDTAEENVVPKRRKEKADSARYNGGCDDRGDGLVVEKGEILKSKEVKGFVEVKSKSSRRHESGSSEKKDEVEKEEIKGGGGGGNRGEAKRKSEKSEKDKDYSGRKESREVREKELSGVEKERKLQDGKDVEVGRKQQGLSLGDVVEERQSKRGKENADWPIQDELQNPETEKELEKRARRRGDSNKDKYQDDVRHSDDKRSSRGDRSKDVKHKDEKHKDERHKDERHGDKYQDDNDKYREDTYRDNRHDGDRGKYREDSGKDSRYREDKYHEHGNKDDRHHRDDRYRDDDKDNRHKEERYRDDVDRDGKHIDAKQKNDSARDRDRDKRARDVKYRDVYSSRDRTIESDMKRSRDENATDLNYMKSSTRDISPIYDDRVPRYKEDKGRRRSNDNECHTDVRSQNSKEQLPDADKRSISSSKVNLVTDKGRSNSCNTDVDATVNHTRHRNSPNSGNHAARDHYRASKPEESKYRDYGFDERVLHNVGSNWEFTGAGLSEKMSSSRSMGKSIQKDDSQIGELSSDRHPRLDSCTSPMRMVNKSPSSTGMERRHLNRLDIRRTIDVEESGQRSGGSREFSSREGRGSREFPVEMHALDEPPQHDGDSNVSSPFNRHTNFSGNSRSRLPPPPSYRTGADSSSVFGNLDDDNRGRPNNRHRRMGDSNMGRPQGNTWKGVPNWPSPVANGFIPFQHGPPTVAFHPVMPQFPAPPMFGVRPPMDMNHNLPFHMPDTDQFPGHGRPLSWRNSADEHGWDGNNSVFGDDAHVYGRLDWDQNRNPMNNRGWDSSGDMWKGKKNIGLNGEMTATPQKEDLALLKADEVCGQSIEESHIELKQSNLSANNIDFQSNDDLNNIADAPKTSPEEKGEIPIIPVKDDIFPYHVYLSKLDISTDLIQPELYDQFSCLMGTCKKTLEDEDNPNILYFEEVLETKVMDKISSNSLYTAISDSVFQKAMSHYNKQKEEIGGINRVRVIPSISGKVGVVQTFDVEKAALNVDKPGKISCDDEQDADSAVPDSEDLDVSGGLQEMEAFPTTNRQKLDEPDSIDTLEVPEAQVSMLNTTEMEVNPVPEEVVNNMVEDNTSPVKDVDILLSGNLEKMQKSDSPEGNHAANSEGNKLIKSKCDPMLLADVSSEVLMPEWIESGSVNLSRIHHSTESTH